MSTKNINFKLFSVFLTISATIWLLGLLIPLINEDNNFGGFIQDFSSTNNNVEIGQFIIFHNLIVVMLIFILGIFSMGLYSLWSAFTNGYILGIYVDYAVNEINISVPQIMKGVLPHFLEIIAIWLSTALSLYCTTMISRFMLESDTFLNYAETKMIFVILLIIIVFVIIAAQLEVQVSHPLIMDNL